MNKTMRICLIFIFNFYVTCVFAQQKVDVSVVAEDQPAVGVSIYVNGKLKIITDEEGKARISHTKDGDTIRTAYLGYKPETIILAPQHTKLNLNLTHDVRELGEVKTSPENDMPIFMRMLKWGLQEAEVHKKTPFFITDTLMFADSSVVCRKITGTFTEPQRGYEGSVTKDSLCVEIIYIYGIGKEDYRAKYENGKDENKLFENYKIPNRDISHCFVSAGYLSKFDREFRLTYLGENADGHKKFHFYILKDSRVFYAYSRGKAYFGGIVYLNDTGIIEKIKYHKTSLDPMVESYEFDIDYSYDEKKNVLMPYQAIIHTYKVDGALNVVLTRRARLEIHY
jgi:hypothetical protein